MSVCSSVCLSGRQNDELIEEFILNQGNQVSTYKDGEIIRILQQYFIVCLFIQYTDVSFKYLHNQPSHNETLE